MERRSKDLEQVLAAKESEIARLRDAVEGRLAGGGHRVDPRQQRTAPSAPLPEDFARSYEYIAGRMRDIDLKIRIILDGLQFRESEERKIGRIDAKLTQLRDEFLRLESGRFRALEGKIAQYCSQKEACLATLESQAEQTKVGLLKLDGQAFSVSACEQKLQAVRKDLEATQRTLNAFETKEFKYENFELESLKTELGRFQKRMTGFEEERKNKLQQLAQLEAQLRHALEHVRHSAIQIENRGLELDKMRRTISTKVVPEAPPLSPSLDKRRKQWLTQTRRSRSSGSRGPGSRPASSRTTGPATTSPRWRRTTRTCSSTAGATPTPPCA